MAEPPAKRARRQNETQTNPGPSTAPDSQAAATQQLPADGVRDDQQTTQSGSGQQQQPPSQLQPKPDKADANESAEEHMKHKAEATVLKDQGNQAFHKSDYTRAVELYTQGLERLKDFVVLYTNRAQAYNKLEKFTEAMEDCRTALQLEPNNVKALLHLGKAHQGLKDYEAAVRTYKEILKIDEKYEKMVADNVKRAQEADANERAEKRKAEATVLKDQGNQAFNKGDYTRAVELYTQGLERLKDFVVLYINRAQAYNKLEKFTEAMEDCRTALQLEPDNVKALVHLGKAHQGLKDYEAAVRTYKEILKIDEKYEKMVADNVKRAQEADANERAEKRKAEATVLKDQGNQAFKEGDYTRAIELYTQGLEHLKDFVVLYTNRAQAYNKLEKFTEAMEDCRTALQLEPNNVKALVHLGKAQQGLKDYEAAVTTYKEITKIDEKYEKMVAGYIAAVNLAESTPKSDMEAERLFSEGDVKAPGIHEIGLSEEITGLQGPYTFAYFQQQIIDNYKDTATTIPAHPTLQSRQVGIEEFFIPLNLKKNIPGKIKSERLVTLPEGKLFLDEALYDILNSLDDLFNQDIVKEIKILLIGGAGTGKSTLLVKVANSSITLRSKPFLSRFDLVLWIKLRQMQQSSCVLDAIFDQILAQDTKLTKPIVKGFIAAHESRTALLLDGLDEIPSHVLQSKEGVYRVQDILHNRVLTKMFVLVTTRPHKVESVLRRHPKFAQVVTTGFNPQNRDQYIRLNLPDDADMGKALVSYLKTNQHLWEMSKVPIISQMMCLVWKNQKSLPERITELFAKFAEVLFIRRNEEMGDQHMMSIMMSIIDDLGRVALQGLLDSSGERLMFNETEFQNCQSSLAEGCHVGFVQRETFTCGLDVKVLVTFPHKSIQEYFAACHLVKLLQDDVNNFLHQLKQIGEGNVLAMEYLLRFCCGRSGQAAGLILNHIREMQGDEDTLQRLARLLLFESSSEELATKLVRPIEVDCKSNEDLKSLSYYLQHVTPPLEGTDFYMHVRKQELTLLRGILVSDSMKSAKQIHVNYRLSEQEEEELTLLEETLGGVDEQRRAQLHIAVIILAKSWFDVGHVSHSFLLMQEQIGTLGLAMVQRSPYEVVDLLKALEGCRLSVLLLRVTDLHARMGDVSHILSSLTVLQLHACRLVDDDVKDLISILPAGHGLEWLDLDDNAFSLDAVRALTHHLRGLPELRVLGLHNNGPDAELVRQVVSQDLPHLKERAEGEF